MVRRQPASRHRWTNRHLRVSHRVHACEHGPRARRGILNGPTTPDLDRRPDVAKLGVVYGSAVAFSGTPRSDSIVVGCTNRILITTFVLWLVVAAFHVRNRGR